jgi:ribosomal protein S18 acetylase RimI-like enzyme
MSPREFHRSLERAIVRMAADNVRRGIWSRSEALETSRKEFQLFLRMGQETPHHRFCHVVDGSSGQRVGEVWYQVEAKGGKIQFWVDWILVNPRYRRRGYASRVLTLLADQATQMGAERIGLHVIADNRPAIALYSKLGFAPSSLRLSKPLGTVRTSRPGRRAGAKPRGGSTGGRRRASRARPVPRKARGPVRRHWTA